MELNFLNQKSCIPSWPVVFHFDSLSFRVNSCVFPLSGILRAVLNLLRCCLPIRFLFYFTLCFFLIATFQSKIIRFLLHPVVVFFRVISSQLLVECTLIVLEYPFLSVLFYPLLIYLLSFASTFWFISSSWTVIFSCVTCSFFHLAYFSASVFFFSFWLVFVFFYLRFQSNFPSRVRLILRAYWGDPNFLSN